MNRNKNLGKTLMVIYIIGLLVFQSIVALALTSSEAKQFWYDAKGASREAKEAHHEAQIQWAVNKTDENNKNVIDTGKASMYAALDEAEAWLIWRQAELEENPEVPEDLRSSIEADIETNLNKIDELRAEVDGVENRIELAIVFLKMVGKYIELVSDVARNSGLVWVHLANVYADTIEDYENQMRDAAAGIQDNDDVIAKLDAVIDELAEARENIDAAEESYMDMATDGSPLLCFSNGNQHLRIARSHMVNAGRELREAYRLLVR